MQLTVKQQDVYDKLMLFVQQKKKRELILFGYAGVGKTVLISKFLNDITTSTEDKKAIYNRVVLAAPTHKAVNIAKSKIHLSTQNNKNNKRVEIVTIHRLLNYQNYIDSTTGIKYFAKSMADPNWSIYNLLIIDECSMLTEQIINDINLQLEKTPNIKIMYVGDSAQLPPVNESASKIFEKEINKLYLDEIVRTKSTHIMELSQALRFWIEGKDIPNLSKYVCDQIEIVPMEEKNKWLQQFISCKSNAIILCWTNKCVNTYNEYIRKHKFGNKILNTYEIGEIVIFNNFHVVKETIENEVHKTVFHTSEQVKITNIEENTMLLDQIGKIKGDLLSENVIKYLNDQINEVNKKLIELQIFELEIQKVDKESKYIVKTIHTNSLKAYNKLVENTTSLLVHAKSHAFKMIHDIKKDNINKCDLVAELEKKMNIIWKAWHIILCEPFAELNYGYAITVHKSQGSTFDNVFIDTFDILSNKNETEMKKCLYTAITRCAEKINMLI